MNAGLVAGLGVCCQLGAVFVLFGCSGGPVDANLCEATQYGVSTSLSDNTAALQAALLSCAGRAMHVSGGLYRFAPAAAYPGTSGFGNGISIPDGTSIVGDGPGKTTLRIDGPGSYVSFFWIQDVSHVSIRDLTIEGNNARDPPPPDGAPACYYDYGHAITIQSTNRPVGGISIASTELISFTGTSWISILAAEGSPGVGVAGGPVTINGNYFQSVQGNAVEPEQIVCAASAVAIEGLGSGDVATASNVAVTRNVVDADYIKTGVAVWSGSSHITIADNSIRNAGKGLPVPDKYSNGSYGILVYQHHSVPPATTVFVRPTDINIFDNEIVNPYSCGIYIAGGQNVRIAGNIISGQIDTYDVTEPRAAIGLNTVNNNFEGMPTPVSGNHISDSAIGISIAGGVLPVVDSNLIESIPSGGVGMKLDGIANDAMTLTLTNTTISADPNARDVSSVLGFFPSAAITIDGLYQIGAAYPLRWFTDIVSTPQQPRRAYCSFLAFGSVKRVFIQEAACSGFTDCRVPQPGYWPSLGAGCSSGT